MNTTTIKTIFLSKKGIKELKKQISQLERDQSKAMTELRELDKTDGHDDRLARIEKLAAIEVIASELNDKQMYLGSAKQLPRKRDALRVAIGSVVDLIDQQGRMVRYTLVDSIEANPSDGRISIMSPLGQSLLGKTVQQSIEWSTAKLHTNQLQLVRIM